MVRSIEMVAASSPDLKRARLAALSNLVKSKKPGHLEKYFQLLTDFDFLAEKIHHPEFGVQALIEDYDWIDELPLGREEPPQPPLVRGENISLNPEKVKTLKRVQGALRLPAHVLAKDKTQLAGQLWGRMQGFDAPEIQQLLSQAKQSKTTWLRPLTPSLTSPGGALLRTLEGHSDVVKAVAVTPDGLQAISGSRDKTLKVWDLASGELRHTLEGHSHSVTAVAVTPDGLQAISGSWENTLKVWNLETAEIIASFTGESPIDCCAVTPDGVTIVAGEESGWVHLLRLEGIEASP